MAAAASAGEAPQIAIPRDYNAAVDLIERNLKAGRGGKVAFRDDRGAYTYGELAERVDRAANALRALGLEPEQRLLLCLVDTIDFPTVFLGAVKAGIVPIAVNTLLTTADYDFMLRDSRARALVVSDVLYDRLAPILSKQPALKQVVVSGTQPVEGRRLLSELMAAAAPKAKAAQTSADDACFWLYSSGSTGTPKGVVHLHSHLILTAELYAKPILGISEKDTVFSASKLFFAYGLGNSLTFPMSVGATAVLLAERAAPPQLAGGVALAAGVAPRLAAALAGKPQPAQRFAGARQDHRIGFAGQPHLFQPLGQPGDGHLGHPELEQRLGRRRHLRRAAVDKQQVRRIAEFAGTPRVGVETGAGRRLLGRAGGSRGSDLPQIAGEAPAGHLSDAGRVVAAPVACRIPDGEAPVLRLARQPVLEHHQRSHHVAALDVADIDACDAQRCGAQPEVLLDVLQRSGSGGQVTCPAQLVLPEGLRGVARHRLGQCPLVPSLRHSQPHPSAAQPGQPLGECLGVPG